MLFKFDEFQFAFNRSLGHEEATTSSAFSVKNLTASMPRRCFSFTAVCLLRFFESANDYKDHYRPYACWHEFFAGD